MTDTHTHLYTPEFESGGAPAVRRALEAGVSMMIFPNIDQASLQPMMELHEAFPDNTRIAIGLHPTELGDSWKEDLDLMGKMLEEDASRFSAIGETGIDLHWDASTLEAQKEAFARQYDWAVRYNLPLIIHCREGVEAALEVIASRPGPRPRMVFHSFTSGLEDVRRIREVCDPWFGINGVVTFKNARALREALPEIGIERIVLETDSPYLAPVPHRGERNESAYIPAVAAKVAEVLGLPIEAVEEITDSNATALFSLSSPPHANTN